MQANLEFYTMKGKAIQHPSFATQQPTQWWHNGAESLHRKVFGRYSAINTVTEQQMKTI